MNTTLHGALLLRPKPVPFGFRHYWMFPGLLLMVATGELRAGGTVTVCNEAGLRAAMAAGGTVTFACGGIITLSNPLTIIHHTTLVGTGRGVVLSGAGRQRVFLVNTGVRLTLIDLTVADGLGEVGAGILNMGGTLELSGVTISNNVARREANYGGGGGIYSTGITRLTNCLFVANRALGNLSSPIAGLTGAGGFGGAVCHFGTELVVESCTFTNNSVTGGIGGEGAPGPDHQPGFPGLDGGAGRGGAIYVQGPAQIARSAFAQNSASGGSGGTGGIGGVGEINGSGGQGGLGGSGAGAGVFLADNTLALTASTFSQNLALGGPGGTGGRGGSSAGLPGSGGKGGSGGSGLGGGLSADAGRLLATNNTWAANQAHGGHGGNGGQAAPCGNPGEGGNGGLGMGGAAHNRNATVVFVNNTIAANASMGGIRTMGAFETCVSVLRRANSGIDGVGVGAGISTETGAFGLMNSLLAGNQPGGNCHGQITDLGFNISSDTSGLLGNESLIGADPMLGPLTNNGGPTLTMALQPGSPAIDFGNHENGPPLDQRGIAREMGLTSDAGAYEFEQPALPRCDETTLQTAVGTGGTINLACEGTFLLTRTLSISQDTVIDGDGYLPIISGRNLVRVFHVQPGVSLTLRHITILHGRSTNGAGIYNEGGTVNLVNCILATNLAVGMPGANGSAGQNQGHNTTVPGGDGEPGSPGSNGMGGGILNTGVLRATNTLFLGNIAQGGSGGDGGSGGLGGQVIDQFFRCRSGGPGGQGGVGARGGDGLGGAILSTSDALLTGCSVLQNQAVGGKGGGGGTEGRGGCDVPGGRPGEGGSGGVGRGGAIYNLGVLGIRSTTLGENGSVGGRGGLGGSGIGGFTSSGGQPGGAGGAADGAALVNQGTNSMENTTIARNQAVGGDGGLGGPHGPGYENNPALSGNGADASGGAVDNWGQLSALNCSIWDNVARAGSGLNGCTSACQGTNGTAIGFTLQSRQGALTVVTNTILGNLSSTNNCFGQIIDGGRNICSDWSAGFSQPGSLNHTDPRLGPMADNGGPALTMAPSLGSPALDAANDLACPAADQRGVSRPQGVQCDIGAVEMRPQELPSLLSIEKEGGESLLIHLLGQPRAVYRLLSSDSFNAWTSVSTNETGADGRAAFTQPPSVSNRFYRAVTP